MSSDLEKRLAALSPEKRALLEQRLSKPRPAPEPPRAPQRRSGDRAPLSFAQERLWFLEQLQSVGAVYNLPAYLRLRQPLDLTALQRSLDEIVRRHEILRTRFVAVDGRPMQEVEPPSPVELAVIDLRGRPWEVREAEAQQIGHTQSLQAFDLEAGPMFRASLIRLADDDAVLMLCMHHIASDGWSLGVLFDELAQLYAAFQAGRPSPLPELAMQYADYALWQRTQLQGDALAHQLAYWRDELAGAPPLIPLPGDRPRPPVQSFRGAVQPFAVPPPLTAAIKALGQREGTTLFMTLLAAFSVLMHRYTDQDDLVIGSPIANRGRVELERLLGFFTNTLALRIRLAGNPSMRELLQRVKAVALAAYAHQEVPFEKLVEILRPERSLGHNPLFQVMFVLQQDASAMQTAPAPATPPAPTMPATPATAGTSKFDLTLAMLETPAGLSGALEYSTDLFDPTTAARMAAHFLQLLEALAADPDRGVATVPFLLPQERQLLEAWSTTAASGLTGALPNAPLHAMIEHEAARFPDAIAVTYPGQVLSYDALNRRANQLAHHLQSLGVGPDVLVGICLHRSLDMIVAVLAVLKSGGAYVPLDPRYPRHRLSLMLADARVAIMVTHAALVAQLPGDAPRVVCLDSDDVRERPDRDPRCAAGPHHLAYVIYTSGSTGKPKGVAITHGGLAHIAHAATSTFGTGPATRMLQFSSLSFDASVLELALTLPVGGTLCLAPADRLIPGPDLVAQIGDDRINTAILPPSALAALDPGELAALRTLIVGGESFPAELAARWLPGRRLFNAYGPTEITICATAFGFDRPWRVPPLGPPLPGKQVHVLDRHLQRVPIGVPGELYVGGTGVARGYLGRPELTAERFLPDPFRGEPGARLYRTGDVVRTLVDGTLEYLGRTDNQVKLRGFRIELDEIRAVLVEHPAVSDCAVVARDDQRLVAYVVPCTGATIDSAELRRALQDRLPDYMVPGLFVVLDALPRMPNGKLDRAALPEPRAHVELHGRAAPRNALERELAAIWAQVLGLDQVGIHDSFFDLGGHSLLMTQVASRVRERLGAELPLRRFMESPTIAALVPVLHRESPAPAPAHRTTIPRLERRRDDRLDAYLFPLSFSQQRLWFLNQLMPGTSVYNIPMVMRVQAPLHVRVLERCLNELVHRHEILRTRFVEIDGEPRQAVAPMMAMPLSVVDLRTRPAETRELEAQELGAAEVQRPFDLAAGALFRASLFRLADAEYLLVLAMHHIVSDGWSVNVIGQELARLYEAFGASRPSPLPELAIQYGDFAAWQRDWLRGDVLATQLAYWRVQLADAPPRLELPTDRPRPAVQSFRGATQLFVVPAATLAAIKQRAREQSATPFMVLLAAFYTLLYRYSGQGDISIGSPIANRNRVELEPLIGFFTNTLVLRARVHGAATFRSLVEHVREITLGAYGHQDLPFEKLVEELQPARSLGHNPLFQVMFSLQNAPGAAAPASSPRPPAPDTGAITPAIHGSAKFDITLSMTETPDGLASAWEYSTDPFDDATMARMIRHFGAVLDGALADPDVPLQRIPLLSSAERHQLVTEWNATAVARPSPALLHEMFEDQVERAPDRVAVVARGAELTYGALNARADELARHLRRRGVAPEVLVGVYLERSIDQLVAILAVLKAGGAYVPVDPSYPPARRAYMIDQSRMAVLITSAALRHGCADLAIDLVCVDEQPAEPGDADRAAPRAAISPENACYVIYTSGSTGYPKGVVIPHRAAVNHMAWMRDRWSFGPDSAVLYKTPASFDASVWEIFVPLVSGARLVVADPQGHRDPAYLVQTLLAEKVTDVQLVPSLLEAVIAEPDLARCLKLRHMFVGGEALPRSLVDRFMKRSAAEVVNLYGPTEVTIQSVVGACARAARASAIEPIGRPIDNLRAYVLDDELQPVPIGVPGELYLAGAGVARGYLHRPGLTAERFVPDPFDERGGGRLYRTGDRARTLPDGTLEFLGRIDDQVKVRGFRIELGEIESELTRCAGVRAAAVIVRDDTGDDKRLTAYVVLEDPGGSVEDLRRGLRERLPEYMVPAAIVKLAELPLLVNGKLDRRALPRPTGDRPELEQHYVAPSTALERVLAQIWTDILGVERVGVDDDFFKLGGHSLVATRVLTRIQSVLEAELPLRQFFEAPTLAGLAAAIVAASRDPDRVEKTAQLVLNVSTMSETDVEALLREKQRPREAKDA